MKVGFGDTVQVNHYLQGRVKFLGQLHSIRNESSEIFVGIELDSPKGNCNGTINGIKYFECKSNYGLLIPPSKITKITKNHDNGMHNFIQTPNVSIGDKIHLQRQNYVGYVRFVGAIYAYDGVKENLKCGIEINKPFGHCDGTLNNRKYFQTKPDCALFVNLDSLKPYDHCNIESTNVNNIDELIVTLDKIEGEQSVKSMQYGDNFDERIQSQHGEVNTESIQLLSSNDKKSEKESNGHDYDFVCLIYYDIFSGEIRYTTKNNANINENKNDDEKTQLVTGNNANDVSKAKQENKSDSHDQARESNTQNSNSRNNEQDDNDGVFTNFVQIVLSTLCGLSIIILWIMIDLSYFKWLFNPKAGPQTLYKILYKSICYWFTLIALIISCGCSCCILTQYTVIFLFTGRLPPQ